MNILGFYWESPEWLLLLIPLAIVWFFVINKKRQAIIKTPGPVERNYYRSWRSRVAPLLKHLPLIALLLFIIGMARPQELYNEEKVTADALDIFLVMDLSSSMLAKDFEPDRISVSKEVAKEFIEGRLYDRIGLVLFAGEAFTQNPLTLDKDVLLKNLDQAEIGMLYDGTFIGMGLATAVNRLSESESNSKIVILLTDGVDNTTQSAGNVNPATAIKLAQTLGIKVYTIGIGSIGQVYKPVRRSFNGDYIFDYSHSEFDEKLLKEIASNTGGRYFRASDEETLRNIYQEIDRLEKTPIEVDIYERTKELYFYFVIAGGLVFLFYVILRLTYFNILHK